MPLSRSQKKKSSLPFFFLGVFLLLFVSSILPGLFFPSDILSYFPSFSHNSWRAPHNSLLADPVFQTEPWREYTKQRLTAGQFPLWNDLNAKGVPFFANMQSAVLYPLNVFYYILPLHTALYFISFMKLYLLGYFVFLYLVSIKISKRVSLIGGVAAAFSGFPLVWLFWSHTNVFILFPLLLYLTERIYLRQKNEKVILYTCISVSYAIAIFGGHPETLFHLFMLHIIYILFRFWKRKKDLALFFLAIISGFLLAAIQLLPFLEYLFHSAAFSARMTLPSSVFFPPLASLQYFFPFLHGAPHTQFYRTIEGINFQESIGGYTGASVMMTAFLGVLTQRKNRLAFFWLTVCFFILAVVFKIWPFWLVTTLPLFDVTANHRLIGFMSIAVCIVFACFLDGIEKKEERVVTKYGNLLHVILAIGICLGTVTWFITSYAYNPVDKLQYFIQSLSLHVTYISLTTAIYFLLLIFLIRKRLLKTSCIFLLLIPILFQTIGLFWNYVPITERKDYYPQIELTKKMQSLQKGTYLEIGNLNLPENINLMYNLNQAENYDAIDSKDYEEAFNMTFTHRNHWNKVDSISVTSLQKFGIQYVLSDFDPNLVRDTLQTSFDQLSPALVSGEELSVVFKSTYSQLREVRFLTANFNRLNICQLVITVSEKSSKKEVAKTLRDCRDVRDKMFMTISIPITLSQGHEYVLKVASQNASEQNAVALWTDKQGRPYTELFYEDVKPDDFTRLWKEGNVGLWSVPHVKEVIIDGSYSETLQIPEKLTLQVHANKDGVMEIKKSFYPGWYAVVDEKKTPLINRHPFMGVYLSKGDHVVTLEYKPLSFRLGFVISLVVLLGICSLFAYNFRRWKRNNKFALKALFSQFRH